jgi:hypothetical protein
LHRSLGYLDEIISKFEILHHNANAED